jgi:hypothetical protein
MSHLDSPDPAADSRRVLDQIERGDIWCGPSAARAIAARHEKAYDSKVWPAPDAGDEAVPDALWAEALAAVEAQEEVVSLASRRRPTGHKAIAEQLRETPGEWGLVAEYRNSLSARGAVFTIRTGLRNRRDNISSPYLPAGAYEARTEPGEHGTRVFARYVGAAQALDAG